MVVMAVVVTIVTAASSNKLNFIDVAQPCWEIKSCQKIHVFIFG